MDEHGESGLTDYQLRFLLRELLAYAEQAPDKDAIVKHLEELLRDPGQRRDCQASGRASA